MLIRACVTILALNKQGNCPLDPPSPSLLRLRPKIYPYAATGYSITYHQQRDKNNIITGVLSWCVLLAESKMASVDSAKVTGIYHDKPTEAHQKSGSEPEDDFEMVNEEERDTDIRDKIRKEVEEGLREDLVHAAVDIHYWSQPYIITKWMWWMWEWSREWCTKSSRARVREPYVKYVCNKENALPQTEMHIVDDDMA